MFVSVDIYTALKEIEHKCYRVWLRSLEAYGNTYFSSSFFLMGERPCVELEVTLDILKIHQICMKISTINEKENKF